MVAFIKKILFKLLRQKSYLKTLHRGFYLLYYLGFLKNDARFKYHYVVRYIIQNDYTIIDIGANLGYFSKNFARIAKKGKVICIEPVEAFYKVLCHFIGSYKNVTIHNCALGNENGTLTMVLPETDGMIRTGLPHISESKEEQNTHKTKDVEVVKGSELLSGLDTLDYIKCDIEGYEEIVFNEIRPIIERHLPIVQIEIDPKNERKMLEYFSGLNYVQYGIAKFRLVREEESTQQEQGDFLFVHSKHIDDFEARMKSKRMM